MLHYSVVFLVIALVTALFGFGDFARAAAGAAASMLVGFIILAAASQFASWLRRR